MSLSQKLVNSNPERGDKCLVSSAIVILALRSQMGIKLQCHFARGSKTAINHESNIAFPFRSVAVGRAHWRV
jgi:hypothetical protein